MTDSIPKVVLQNLGNIAEETGKEIGVNAIKMTDSIISGKDLVGDIKPMSDEELARKKAEDERKVAEEKNNLAGRNVEGEIKQIREDKAQTEKEQEEQMLAQIKQQREAEEAERQQLMAQDQESSNPAKRKKSAGSAFVQGKKKSQQPDPSQMSQTSEFKGKID